MDNEYIRVVRDSARPDIAYGWILERSGPEFGGPRGPVDFQLCFAMGFQAGRTVLEVDGTAPVKVCG